MEQSRSDKIHEKGFNIVSNNVEFNKAKIDGKILENIALNLSSISNLSKEHGYRFTKADILRYLAEGDAAELRRISRIFYGLSGVYQRACNYAAYLYRYDWYISSEIKNDNYSVNKLLKDFNKILNYLDRSYIKKLCGEIALDVILDGVYYGYIVPSPSRLVLQKLPIQYCRSRYNVNGAPAVEFNMTYFESFGNLGYRQKVLNIFPKEFQKGYVLYKQGKLLDEAGMPTAWFLLTPGSAVKFTLGPNEFPLFVSAIPAIIDLDAAQELDRRKQMQKLLKIIVQKLPMDKNGDLIFDVDEAKEIHTNAVRMLANAIGVDVLTTFADIDAIDTSDRNSATTTDDLEKVERTVFNTMGLSRNLFNTDGNLSLEKSILNDESTMRGLLLQFAQFFDYVVDILNNNKNYEFRYYMLETTQYNYKEMAKLYKEQIQYGYSKMLPQIALGHAQSFILNTARFENEVLDLNHLMLPPLSSNTMNAEDFQILGSSNKTNQNKNQNNTEDEKSAGRPELAEDQKSDKTLANEASKE